MNMQIGIIGPETKNMRQDEREELSAIAKKIGQELAKQKAILITGGCSGVVEEAVKGAKEFNGLTVGTPGRQRGTSVEGIDVEICTPIEIGDYVFAGVLSCDAIIVIPGDAGTMAELAIAYRNKKPLIFIKGYKENMLKELFNSYTDEYPMYIAEDAEQAANIAIQITKEIKTQEPNN